MERLSRVTPATVDVLRELVEHGEPVWGLRIVKATGRPAGSVYPILDRLERAGWAESSWEDAGERPGPRRRYYRLTAAGAAEAATVIGRFDSRPSPGRAARTTRATSGATA